MSGSVAGANEELARWAELKRLSFIVDGQIPFELPAISRSERGQIVLLPDGRTPEVSRLHQILYELAIVSPDHHPGLASKHDPEVDVSKLTGLELRQLLTWVSRTSRFVDGLFTLFLNSSAVTRAVRRLYLLEVCDEAGWPRAFPPLTDRTVTEGFEVRSKSGAIEGRTSGSRRKCSAIGCPGWFIGVLWETGQQMYICSEGWHYDPVGHRIEVIGGGEISARFISPKPLGRSPAPP